MPLFSLRAVPHALSLALLPVVLSPTAQAQTPLPETRMEPVIVTGTREPQALRHSVADVVLIDGDTLRDSGVDSVEDALRRFASVRSFRNGGPGHASGYAVRGAGTGGTIVLVDGVRVGSATLGQASFESMSLSQIEHIEVLRGPASGLYGADAVGGVIQIFTKRGAGAAHVTANLTVGGYHSREQSLAVSGAQEGFDYAASVGHETSRGVSTVRPNDQSGNFNPDDDGFRRRVADVRVGFSPKRGHRIGFTASGSTHKSQFDSSDYLPDLSQDPSPNFRDQLRTRVEAVDYRGELSATWTTSVQAAQSSDDSLSGGTSFSRYRTDRNQFTWQNALRLTPEQQLVLAYENLREEVRGDAYAAGRLRTNQAVFGGYTGQFGATALEASLRSDDNSAYGRNTTGSVGASQALTPTLKARAGVGKTFRAPTFNDLFFPGYGVSTIQPEAGRSVEAGLNWQDRASSAALTVYRQKVRNLIVFVPMTNGTECPAGYTFGCAGNAARVTLEGLTVQGAHRVNDWQLQASVDLLHATDDDTGKRLTRRATHQDTLAVDRELGLWSLGASLVFTGSRPDGSVQLGGYGVLDLRAHWRFEPQWRLETKVLNAGDRKVEPLRDYQGLGRQVWVGVRYDMKGF